MKIAQTTGNEHDDAVFQRLDLIPSHNYPTRIYAKRLAWEWVQRLLIRPSPTRAYGWRRFWLRLFGAKLHFTCLVRAGARILHPWLLTVGRHSILGDCTIWNLGPVSIGDHTVLSQNVYVCAGMHDYTRRDFPLQSPPIRIGSGVWICAGAFIGPKANVGNNSVVGACAVVLGEVPAGMIVGGNPARVIKPRLMRTGSSNTVMFCNPEGGTAARDNSQ